MLLNTIFFIGPQGSGKGTQAKMLAEKLGFFHWDNGAILREAAQSGSDLGNQAKRLMDQGVYLPDELLMQIARAKLESLTKDQGVIFDGLPRRLSQAKFLLEFLKSQGKNNFATVFLNLPKEVSLQRLLMRAQTQGRTDDNEEAIGLRLQQYYQETLPVLEFLKQQTQFFEIEGNKPIAEVSNAINSALGL